MTTEPAGQQARDPFLSLKRGGTELYFVRHGDALPDQDEITLGDYDAQALSDLGRRQAQALARRMASYEIAAVYSSPVPRAAQTARALTEALDLEVHLDPDLREVELGQIGAVTAGMTDPAAVSALIRQRLREIAEVAVAGDWSVIPGSEPRAAVRARALSAVARIHAAHPGQRVAVFSHGGLINAFFAAIIQLDRDYFFPAANTSVSVARVLGERSLLMALNDVTHLREGGLLDESVRPPAE